MNSLRLAGYILTDAVSRPPWSDRRVLPDRFWSASECIAPRFPGTEMLSWVKFGTSGRRSDAGPLQLRAASIDAVARWADAELDILFGRGSIFATLDDARVAQRFAWSHSVRVTVLALGLDVEEVPDVLEVLRPLGGSGAGAGGVYRCLSRDEVLPAGQFLGYEPLNIEHSDAPEHSWICNSLEPHFAARYALRLNNHGLIDSPDSARIVCRDLNEEKVPAEGGVWSPWALVRFG